MKTLALSAAAALALALPALAEESPATGTDLVVMHFNADVDAKNDLIIDPMMFMMVDPTNPEALRRTFESANMSVDNANDMIDFEGITVIVSPEHSARAAEIFRRLMEEGEES